MKLTYKSVFSSMALIMMLLVSSCSKPDIEQYGPSAKITLNLTKANWFGSKERGEYCNDLYPVKAVMSTDKGAIEFNIIEIKGGYHTQPIEVLKDLYVIERVRLYDIDGKLTHNVYEGKPDNDGSIVGSWVNDYEYDLTEDRDIVFQIFCN